MTKTIYYSGIYKNVGKKPTMAEKKRMKEKAEKIQKEIRVTIENITETNI